MGRVALACVRGGAAKKEGAAAGPRWRSGAVFPRTPLSRASRAARSKGGAGVVHPPSARIGRGRGGVPSHAPFPRVQGGAVKGGKGGAGGDGVSLVPLPARAGRRALVHPPSAQMGKGGAGGGVPLSRAYRAARPKGKGRGGSVPHASSRTYGAARLEGRCRGRRALVYPPFRASGAGGDEPSRRGSGGAGHDVPSCAPFRANGKSGAGGRVPPFHVNWVARRGKGE
ncbi:hypothetical protein EDB89DRAFT_1986093 [Lactarius sanguifluus]|nr:hypothetical protein EDB89DRAFT_1986093 [Lactarius sanguifluus]